MVTMTSSNLSVLVLILCVLAAIDVLVHLADMDILGLKSCAPEAQFSAKENVQQISPDLAEKSFEVSQDEDSEPIIPGKTIYRAGDPVGITTTGAWEFNETFVYPFDAHLAKFLALIVKSKTVLELGAGRGHYTREFAKEATKVDAVDGAQGIEELSGGYVKHADLTRHLNLGLHDWVICMEVGEHVPKEYELSVFDNINRHSKEGVILSWAVPGQVGKGHVNCHSNEYIRAMMGVLGYSVDQVLQDKARKLSKFSWFKNTLMVFRRKEDALL